MITIAQNENRVIIEEDPDSIEYGGGFLQVRDLITDRIVAHCIQDSEIALEIAYDAVYTDGIWRERVQNGLSYELGQGLPVAVADCLRRMREAVH